MTDVVTSTETEVLTEVSAAFTIEVAQDAVSVVTETSDGTIEIQDGDPTILVTTSDDTVVSETPTAEVITSAEIETVYAVEPVVTLIEAAEQGPRGPAGPTGPATAEYPGKTLGYTVGVLTDVYLYSDVAKTDLVEHRVLIRVAGVLTSIEFYDGTATLVKTRTLTYTTGLLTGVVDA